MYKIEMSKTVYESLKSDLEKFRPNIQLILVECDDALERLGFCESAPCIVHVDLTEEEMELLLDDLMQLEIDAYNTETGKDPLPNDPFYLLYREFGWMWGVFHDAEWIDE